MLERSSSLLLLLLLPLRSFASILQERKDLEKKDRNKHRMTGINATAED
jgi:hypothetical protein